jgi:hypothetical protein
MQLRVERFLKMFYCILRSAPSVEVSIEISDRLRQEQWYGGDIVPK